MQLPVDVLSREQVERLLSYPDTEDVLGLRDAAVLATLYHAGATAGELASLNVGDLEVKRCQLLLRGDDGARRRVTVDPSVAALLDRYKREARQLILVHGGSTGQQPRALFLGNKPHRVRVQDIRQILGANVKGAGVDAPVNLNTLRLSRAWHLREEGKSPESIQRFLGATSRSGRNVI